MRAFFTNTFENDTVFLLAGQYNPSPERETSFKKGKNSSVE